MGGKPNDEEIGAACRYRADDRTARSRAGSRCRRADSRRRQFEKFDGDRLTVKEAGSGTQTVMLSADAKIYGVEKRRLSDIKPGDFVASGEVRGTDGQIHAVELRIFPESMRGVGEGQRPWDVKPEGVMTNATVGTYRRRPTAASSMLPTRAASPNMSSDPMSRCWPMSWRTERC